MPNSSLHTVLGASGSVGLAVIKNLQEKNVPIRAISRSIKIEGIDTVSANLLQKEEVKMAIKGSTHVYLCVGLPYSIKVWQRDWPILMENTIEACLAINATLIFLDNIYMYGPKPLASPFDENHPQHPQTQKGKVRKKVTDMLLKAITEKNLTAVIGRAADFYGPNAKNSMLYFSFLENMLQGKGPQSLAKLNVKHTFANVADLGRALVALAMDSSTYAQVWHLPAGPPITIAEMTQLFNHSLGTDFKASVLPTILRKVLSLFIPPLKEVGEMLYQFNEEYIMSFEKFNQHFPDFKVTPYQEGIKEMIESFK